MRKRELNIRRFMAPRTGVRNDGCADFRMLSENGGVRLRKLLESETLLVWDIVLFLLVLREKRVSGGSFEYENE